MPKKDKNVKNKVEIKNKTIGSCLSVGTQEIIKKIRINYYINMSSKNIEQKKYMDKYDKLESILESDKNNKRAKMELLLTFINEGYREEVKQDFEPEDYELINMLVDEYLNKKIKAKDAIKEIDDYCK